jgi:hypothetical protein
VEVAFALEVPDFERWIWKRYFFRQRDFCAEDARQYFLPLPARKMNFSLSKSEVRVPRVQGQFL